MQEFNIEIIGKEFSNDFIEFLKEEVFGLFDCEFLDNQINIFCENEADLTYLWELILNYKYENDEQFIIQ